MKFRVGATGWLVFGLSLAAADFAAAATPCPPPQLSVDGGSSVGRMEGSGRFRGARRLTKIR